MMAESAGDPTGRVLHALRVKGFASVGSIADFSGLRVDIVQPSLAAAAEQGWAVFRDGRLSGWKLTPSGTEVQLARVAAELSNAGCRRAIEAADARFVDLNGQMKALFTDWQLRGQPAECVRSLARVHPTIVGLCDELGHGLSRFNMYSARFASALERLQAGDNDAFTMPLTGSYHDVWMELHQDLLVTLARNRGADDGY